MTQEEGWGGVPPRAGLMVEVAWGKWVALLVVVPGEGAQERPATPPRAGPSCAWRRARARPRARVLRSALRAEFGEG